MGLTLTNEQIDLTYAGLIKMNDNVGVTAVLKPLSDGLGTDLPFEVSTTGVNFTGTVTGIPTPAPSGLVAGTGTDSMRSGDSLTATASVASNTDTIAIGNGAQALAFKNIAIGTGTAKDANQIIIGDALGNTGTASANSIAIGNNYSISLDFRGNSVSLGNGVYPSARGTYIGNGAFHNLGGAEKGVALGFNAQTSQADCTSLGADTLTTAVGSTAIGKGVTAAIANTASLKELEVQTVGGGITMYSPDGTAYKLTVANGGTLVIT